MRKRRRELVLAPDYGPWDAWPLDTMDRVQRAIDVVLRRPHPRIGPVRVEP